MKPDDMDPTKSRVWAWDMELVSETSNMEHATLYAVRTQKEYKRYLCSVHPLFVRTAE